MKHWLDYIPLPPGMRQRGRLIARMMRRQRRFYRLKLVLLTDRRHRRTFPRPNNLPKTAK